MVSSLSRKRVAIWIRKPNVSARYLTCGKITKKRKPNVSARYLTCGKITKKMKFYSNHVVFKDPMKMNHYDSRACFSISKHDLVPGGKDNYSQQEIFKLCGKRYDEVEENEIIEKRDVTLKKVIISCDTVVCFNKNIVRLLIGKETILYPYHQDIAYQCSRIFEQAKERDVDIDIYVHEDIICGIRLQSEEDIHFATHVRQANDNSYYLQF